MTHSPTVINPHAAQPTSLVALVRNLWRNRHLILQMTKREVLRLYKGSIIGLAWAFFNPIFMLAVYTVIFSVVFKARWGSDRFDGDENKLQFAVVIFVGMIVLGLVSDALNRAPGLILSNVNFVKKVVFPIEILPVVAMGTAFFHSLISLSVLLAALVFFNGYLNWTVVFIPLILLPLLILSTGLSWILASLGVFLRDVGQVTGVITRMLLFLSPVFYQVSAVPEKFRPIIMANPLTFIIEQAREVLIWGHLPNWLGLGIYTLVATSFFFFVFSFFNKNIYIFSVVI